MKMKDLTRIYEKHLESYENHDYDEAIKILKEYIEICDNDGIKGDYYYQLEKLLNVKVINAFDKEKSEKIYSLSKLFNEKFYSGQFDEALKIGEEHYNLSRGADLFACLHLGTFYLEKGGLTKAEIYFDEALELNPTSPRTYAKIVALNIKELNLNKAYENLKLLEKYDKNTHYYTYLFKYELDYLRENTATLDKIINNASKSLNEDEYNKFATKLDEFLLLNKDKPKIIVEPKEKPTKPKKENHIENIKKFLIPDENNVVRPYLIDEYLKNLDIDDNELGILQLDVAKLLASKGYNNYADKLIRKTEKVKNKSGKLKTKLNDIHKEMRLIKNR